METVNEKHVRVAAKLYEARDSIRRLLPPKEYRQSINFMKAVLRRVQEQQPGCNEITAAMWLIGNVKPADAAEKMLILATAVEMVEPSFSDSASEQHKVTK